MKGLLLATALLFTGLGAKSAYAQEAPPECTWQEIIYCNMSGCFPLLVCAGPGSCPSECWCPGRGGCGVYAFPGRITQTQKQGLDILVARFYQKKPVDLTLGLDYFGG
jgi:hypothetical protein